MRNNKRFVVEANFIKEAYKQELSLNEFLLLLYFENSDDLILDFDLIEKKLKISKESILDAFNSLFKKNVIGLVSEKDSTGKRFDKISLDNFYNNIKETKKKEEKRKLKGDIFTTFESEFKRPLTGMEFEVIKAWLDKSYDEELIIHALKEAVYNGAISIRYIDTILHEWNKKGYKTKDDVINGVKKKENKRLEETNILEYNWLDDYDR